MNFTIHLIDLKTLIRLIIIFCYVLAPCANVTTFSFINCIKQSNFKLLSMLKN